MRLRANCVALQTLLLLLLLQVRNDCVLRVTSVSCSVDAQAYSANNYIHTDNYKRYGYVKLNGVAVWQASWLAEYPRNRGSNVIIVDLSTCTMREWRLFDTYGDTTTAARLRDYIQGLSDGTVLVGVSTDEASRYLDAAEATLSGLGADVSDVGYRGAWAFVAEIGDPSKTVLDKELTEAAANARQPIVTAGAQCDQSINQSIFIRQCKQTTKKCGRLPEQAIALQSWPP